MTKTEYVPKFCRSRGCTQKHGHEGRCTGRGRQPISITIPEVKPRRMVSTRYVPRKSPKALPVHGARERMAWNRLSNPTRARVLAEVTRKQIEAAQKAAA